MNPKVSIVVPVYNTKKYLERCFESLKNQTLKDIEIIFVDDESPDGAGKLCDEIAKIDDRVKVIHKKNQGLGMARNSGIDAARGEFVGFVDSDDYIEENMYESLYEAAKKEKAQLALSGICFVGGNMFSEKGEITKKMYFDKLTTFEGKSGIKKLLLGVVGALPFEPDDSRYGMSVCKNIFERKTIEKNNISFLSEREVLSEDAIFMVDFIKCTNCAVGLPEAFYCYYRNENSISKTYQKERFLKSMFFLKELEKRISDFAEKEEYKIYLDRLTQGFGRVLCSQEIMYAKDKKIKFADLRKRLKEICTRDEIADVLKTYPWYKLPVKQAVFAFAMKYKLYFLQKIIVTLRDR